MALVEVFEVEPLGQRSVRPGRLQLTLADEGNQHEKEACGLYAEEKTETRGHCDAGAGFLG